MNPQQVNADGRIYLDYAATTPLDEAALEAMLPLMRERFGNASALYSEGREARDAVNAARRSIAASLGCRDPFDITFTSGGTESDNTAIAGISLAARAKMKSSAGPGHIICSAFEHHAVLNAVARMRSMGFEISHVGPRADGVVHPEDVEALMRPDTVLVSVMAANNEIGTIQPISSIAEVVHAHGSWLHTDAVGAIGKTDFSLEECGADSVSIASHKVYGPKGIGALYLSKQVPFEPLIHGGGQEKGRRSGTYDTASIVGFAKALELNVARGLYERLDAIMACRDRLLDAVAGMQRVESALPIERGNRERNLASFAPLLVDGMESEDLVRIFDAKGFAISGGSACTSGSGQTSHALASIGISPDRASGFIRITLGKGIGFTEIDRFAQALHEVAES
ncbi:MAG: cysteine desulfurase [bacterium]|nr:cysteine desulfurase [bacterium]